jgi:3-dehydroquinate dehydratase / shikimate dehydrogenase
MFGKGKARVCGVAAAASAAAMIRQVRAALRQTPTVEVRLDWLSSDAERLRFLEWMRKHRPRRSVLIATCRRKVGGGRFGGSASQELVWLAEAKQAGFEWCDLEIETRRKLSAEQSRDLEKLPKILLSQHDFLRTPKGLSIRQLQKQGTAAAVKVAAQATSIADSLRVLQLAKRQRNVVAVPMGEAGFPGRMLALREGSALAYAPVENSTAPGQVPLTDVLQLYRTHELTRKSRVYGVIGEPIGHSLSPLMHNVAFRERGIDAVLLPFLVRQLRDFLTAAPELGVRGFAVTIPHKQNILNYLDNCDDLAADIGAVNTVVVRRDGSLHGHNTDYIGVLRALEKRMRLANSRVLVLGAGGAARAAAFALARSGAQVGICARRESTARELARAVRGEVVPRKALRSQRFDAILNSTPIGMYPHEAVSPLAAGELHCRIVMDLIYRPERTRLLKIAAQKGVSTVSGVDMFLAQGIAQWEMWMRRPAPAAAMRWAVLSALRGTGHGFTRDSSRRSKLP